MLRSHFNLTMFAIFLFVLSTQAQKLPTQMTQPMPTAFEKNKNTTATYTETIAYYEQLAESFPSLQFKAYGTTDSGHPLHLAILSSDNDFDPASIRRSGKNILMINNAIHPGEPCGVDATMIFLRNLLTRKERQTLLEHTVIIAIPIYNIGGALNRNSTTRANQNGPEAYGFRGNAKNLDLNRDFIKCDSRNARTFNQIFNEWNPDVLIDNHTSNGADYQYTMTLIATQHNKLNKHLSNYLQEQLLPKLYTEMKARDWEMTPYVYAREKPDDGIAAFLDLPRYSSGYAALHHCLSFMPETHMLKPYADRVASTLAFMEIMLTGMDQDHTVLAKARQQAFAESKTQNRFDLNWTMDREKVEQLLFKGYEAAYKPSEISGKDRLYYDRSKPFEKLIPYYKHYKTTMSVEKPVAYIIPQAYVEVIERLQWNGVELKRLTEDQTLDVSFYTIEDFKSVDMPYEGHYLHRDIEVSQTTRRWKFYKGDYVVVTNQNQNQYIVQTLEPQAPDGFFAWNFFDGILMQKEYFSPYVFEDLAATYVEQNPELEKELAAKQAADPEFADSAYEQLKFIYQKSPHYEPTYRLYPVGRLSSVDQLRLVEVK